MSVDTDTRLALLELEQRIDDNERVIRDLVIELTGRGSSLEIGARRFLYISGLFLSCGISVLGLLGIVYLIAQLWTLI